MSVVGIDLGTTNTVVGCVRTGKVHVLADEKGVRLLPSVVSFHPNGEVLVGGAAKQRRVIDAKNTVYSHKRLIGRSWGSPEIAQAKQRFAFELREGPGQGPLIHARGQDYTLPEISAFVLKRARQIAETALGTPVERAVITVPAHFNELQRASTKVAGRVSGLEVLRILNEPTAAALAYGLGRTGNERVAVYDFGGGTFDCTLLDLNGNVFEVLATAGDSFLGGDDVDNLIADRMAEQFLKQHRQDARQDPETYERLKTTAEEVKIALSTAESHTVMLKELGHGAGGAALNFQFTMTRKDFDAMITPLVDRTFKVTQDALALARLSPTSFDKVILVGGSTRMPLVRKRVESFFGGPPMDRVNPDEVVAIGAAIQAAALTEGIRRRSIPAPPGVPRHPSQNDTQDNTQTSELDPSMLKPAFGSEPPGFGFQSSLGSQPPTDKFAFASTIGSTPPANNPIQMPPNASVVGGPGVPGARVAPGTSSPIRKATNPGVAPATQPMGARSPAQAKAGAQPPSQANEEDPSMASFPDLSAPTPFEWYPSSGSPTSGDTTQRNAGAPAVGAKPSERTFGGDPQTLTETAVAAQGAPQRPGGPLPAAGKPAPFATTAKAAAAPDPSNTGSDVGFGAIDEPPSLFSTPSGSLPSFPSFSSSNAQVPSPLGDDPAPWRAEMPSSPTAPAPTAGLKPGSAAHADALPEGQFGQVHDLSLVSSTGVSSSGVSNPGEVGFGHVSDLSLISNQTATAAMDAITNARNEALDSGAFDEQTEAIVRKKGGAGNTLDVPPAKNPGNPAAYGQSTPRSQKDEHDSLIDRTDLPAVVQKAKPARKPGQVGMSKDGSPSMMGKAPPIVAPQPFGPMERMPVSQRTAAMPSPAPAAKPNKPPPVKPQTAPMQGKSAGPPPFNQTTPLGAQSPAGQGQPAHRGAATEAFGSTAAVNPPQQPPPLPQQGPYASAPPMQGGFSQPPQQPGPQPFSFGSSPPGAFGSPMPPAPGFQSAPPMQQQPQPPQQQGGSQPPIFGSFSSAPPDPSQPLDFAPGGRFDPQVPQAPGAPQGITYQAPVLVDVTPRGLVVETAGGYTDTIIPRNSKIPCERTRRFATGRDMQTSVRVRVAQGESPMFPQNTYLGEVELSGLRPAARGEVTVAVTFEVDADGTLRVRARDVQTGQEARATLQLVGVADESSVVMMINRFAQQPVVGGPTRN